MYVYMNAFPLPTVLFIIMDSCMDIIFENIVYSNFLKCITPFCACTLILYGD